MGSPIWDDGELWERAGEDSAHRSKRLPRRRRVLPGPGFMDRASDLSIVVLISYHGAKLYHVDRLLNESGEAVGSYSAKEFFRHERRGSRQGEHRQGTASDQRFYRRVAEYLGDADRIVLLSHGTRSTSELRVMAEWLEKSRPDVYARIVREARVDTSTMTEAEVMSYAGAAFGLRARFRKK